MARITYESLFLNFVPDATDKPKTTEIDTLIDNYYAQSYEIIYGIGNYADPDTATSDPQTIIQSSEFESNLVAELSWKVQQWHDSGMSSSGEVIKMPNFDISGELEKKLRRMAGKKNKRLRSIRVMGSEYTDAGVL